MWTVDKKMIRFKGLIEFFKNKIVNNYTEIFDKLHIFQMIFNHVNHI